MKYLIYVKPSEKISEEMEEYRLVNSASFISVGTLHCTLMTGRFSPDKEEDLKKSLEAITFNHFEINLECLALFDKRNDRKSLVVQIEKSPALASLHLRIIKQSRKYMLNEGTPPLEEWGEFSKDPRRKTTYERYGSPFFGEFYTPHLSLGEVVPHFSIQDTDIPFLHEKWIVTSFYLARKDAPKEKEWKELQEYQARPFPT